MRIMVALRGKKRGREFSLERLVCARGSPLPSFSRGLDHANFGTMRSVHSASWTDYPNQDFRGWLTDSKSYTAYGRVAI
jgi:hypothetical protein